MNTLCPKLLIFGIGLAITMVIGTAPIYFVDNHHLAFAAKPTTTLAIIGGGGAQNGPGIIGGGNGGSATTGSGGLGGSAGGGAAATCAVTGTACPAASAPGGAGGAGGAGGGMGTLKIIKIVGGCCQVVPASVFTFHITGNNPSPSTFHGSETGNIIRIGTGQYTITEEPFSIILGPPNERTLFFVAAVVPSGDCRGAPFPNENIITGNIKAGETKTCIITNEFSRGPI